MKKVTLKRSQVVPKTLFAGEEDATKLSSLFHFASTVTAGDSDEGEAFRRFKYACGKNRGHAESAEKAIITGAREVMVHYPIDVMDKYNEGLKACYAEYDGLTEDGELDPAFLETLPQAARERLKANIDAMVATFPEIQECTDKNDALLDEYLDGDIDLMIHCIPWSTIPEKLNGSWLVQIECMIDDIPEDLREDIKKTLDFIRLL